MSRSKQELEDRHLRLNREKAELSSQLNENEEELQVQLLVAVGFNWTKIYIFNVIQYLHKYTNCHFLLLEFIQTKQVFNM